MRENIQFQTSDNVILRGWLYKPDGSKTSLPCLVMAHGFSGVKEMGLDAFAESFISRVNLACLVYDNRGFGNSDTRQGQPKQEILPAEQISDYSDAITYAQSRPDVIKDKIGVWGSSYSGGHVLVVGATDRRVKVVLSQVPCTDGWACFHRGTRPDFIDDMNQMFENDRRIRAEGSSPGYIPVIDADRLAASALPTPDSFEFFSSWVGRSSWVNRVTIRSIEALRAYKPVAHIQHISPTPLLMTVMSNDVVAPTDLALETYSQALEPKQLQILPGGHFEAYSGPIFEKNVKVQCQFLQEHLALQ
ncbi:Esterase lipase [Fusarium albosuccineum]|uniref:Esterase lipase n=1 Tax=Fusarium albosuccineum TaxID=1237068 RepID=A0A8H4NPH5_9HYPO|nr:Esterase lipase [Fusarium albosuccineum]